MIISASYRSDIPAFHGHWFLDRLAAGSVAVRNPYGGRESIIDLRPAAVDGYVFWTRNPVPFLPALEAVETQEKPFVIQLTVTGMPRALERRTPAPDTMIAAMRALRGRYGPDVLVWRFDPILASPVWPLERQLRTFERLSAALRGVTDEVCVSWATLYRKSLRNLGKAGIPVEDPAPEEKRAFLAKLADRAEANRMALTVCSQSDLVPAGGRPAACIDAARLSRVANREILARQKGNRPGCLCAASRDIGAYDSCAHGCLYCYAVADHDKARRSLKAAKPDVDTEG